MNTIYEKNLAWLAERFPEMSELYQACEKTTSGKAHVQPEFAAIEKERAWYFTSRYNQEEAARIWAGQFEKKERQLYIMVGMGNGTYLRALIQRLPRDCGILVYEPEFEIFEEAMHALDLSRIFEGRSAIVVDTVNKGHIYEFFIGTINYENRNQVHFCIHPNYDRLYPEQVEWVRQITENEISIKTAEKNTELCFSHEFFRNMMANLWDYVCHSTLENLRQALEPVKEKGIPAVIVAAGPSLNKNVEELKAYRRRVFVIACDSAINPLVDRGIIPDLAISVDAHKPQSLFSREATKKIPFALCLQTIQWFRNVHEGKKFYFGDNILTINMMENYGKYPGVLETSGSVANNAFSLAKELGFHTIILIGQDLSYDNGKYYAKGVHANENDCAMVDGSKEYFEIDGYYGGKVYTNYSLNMYRMWFEKQIVRYPKFRVINATQGGAMIAGAQNMDLRQALEEECKEEIDFSAFIESARNAFAPEELEKVRQDFFGFEEVLKDIKKDIEEGIRNYHRLDDLLRRGKQGGREFHRLFQRNGEIQRRIDEEPLMDLAAMHNREVEYKVLDEVRQDGANAIEEARSAIRSGIRMLESYGLGTDKVLEGLPILYGRMESRG